MKTIELLIFQNGFSLATDLDYESYNLVTKVGKKRRLRNRKSCQVSRYY
jgi:hypothetical protein